MNMKIRYILFLLTVGFPAGIMCHAESRLFHGPETGYRRTSLEPAGNPGASRRQDLNMRSADGTGKHLKHQSKTPGKHHAYRAFFRSI